MAGEKIFDSPEEFTAFLKNEEIDKLSFSEVCERRAVQTSDLLEVIVVKKVDLLAYKNSTIYKCAIATDDLDGLYENLVSRGFEVNRKSRNIS
jgi:hypothetical protein